MRMNLLSRRQAIRLALALPILPLAGCRASLPKENGLSSSDQALSLLRRSAEAHGLSAYAQINDVNVSYAGRWRWLVGRLQPALVDSQFRGGSQERWLPREGIYAQSHSGPQGHKQVFRAYSGGEDARTRVWFNGQESQDREQIDAAALVIDAYQLFLLGPMLLAANDNPRREIRAALAKSDIVEQAHQKFTCEVLSVSLNPGLGNSPSDRLALYIDRETHLMRRVRMTLNGLESTRGALVDIDTYEHRLLEGIFWPTVFHEQLRRPAPLDVHTWRLTGLDVNRGETAVDVSAPEFSGKAIPPASRLL
jgi:hypothetical protein